MPRPAISRFSAPRGSSGAETVDNVTNQFPTIRVTSDGSPRAAYLSDDLVFAQSDGSGWATEIARSVDPTQVKGLAMDLDSNGFAHIIYALDYGDWVEEEVYWLHWDGYEWQHSTIKDQHAGRPVDLELTSDDRPYIAYASYNGYTYYLYWTGTEWADGDGSAPHGGDFDLLLNADNVPRLVYVGTDDHPWYFCESGSTTIRVKISDAHSVLQDISAVIGPQPGGYGTAYHVTYGDTSSNALIRAYSTLGHLLVPRDHRHGHGYRPLERRRRRQRGQHPRGL